MRLITWNCRVGGFCKKSAHIAPYQPDVLAVQEVEPLDRVKVFAGDTQPTLRDRWHSEQYPRRSIGLFSYTDTDLKPVDYPDPAFSFRRFEASHESRCFQVAAVWTYATKIRKNSYRQAHARALFLASALFGWETPKFYLRWLGPTRDLKFAKDMSGVSIDPSSPGLVSPQGILLLVKHLMDPKWISMLKENYRLIRKV